MLWGLGHRGFSSLGMQAQWLGRSGSGVAAPGLPAQAQYSWCSGLVSRQPMGSSRIGDQTCIFSAWAGGLFPTEPPGKPENFGFYPKCSKEALEDFV